MDDRWGQAKHMQQAVWPQNACVQSKVVLMGGLRIRLGVSTPAPEASFNAAEGLPLIACIGSRFCGPLTGRETVKTSARCISIVRMSLFSAGTA